MMMAQGMLNDQGEMNHRIGLGGMQNPGYMMNGNQMIAPGISAQDFAHLPLE